jgi:hypothetical protein
MLRCINVELLGGRVAAEPSAKSRAWVMFDQIVADASPDSEYTNPWVNTGLAESDPESSEPRPPFERLRFEPNFEVLRKLLGVPLHLGAESQTGVPALALDVWIAYELRRAGFDVDAVWPRAVHPRVLPSSVVNLLAGLPLKERVTLEARLKTRASIPGVSASSASILGNNYLKQVDVVMSNWVTGPELLISTKRMDSSFGKNAANRVEESYGDVKNLRLRHPMAALGFFYGLRSTIFEQEPDKAEWLIDLLQKLGQEDDAYHSVALLVIDYDGGELAPDDLGDGEDALAEAQLSDGSAEDLQESAPAEAVPELPPEHLPRVEFAQDRIPPNLQPSQFLATMVNRVLDTTPITLHTEARKRRASPR